MPRRDEFEDEDERPKSRGMSTAVIVVIVVGILGFMTLACGGILIGFLLSTVKSVREAGARAESENTMKAVLWSVHNYDLANNRLPGAVSVTNGTPNPGLSFRVDLLLYMEHASLYKQIDLTQAWDSATNKPLTDTPIPEFLDPGNPASTGNMTPYRQFVGPGAMFDGSHKPVKLFDIADGVSKTIYFVSATETVPWAKPKELAYGPGVPLPALGNSPAADGFHAAFADGSVKFLKKSIPEADLRSLIEMADGRTVQIP